MYRLVLGKYFLSVICEVHNQSERLVDLEILEHGWAKHSIKVTKINFTIATSQHLWEYIMENMLLSSIRSTSAWMLLNLNWHDSP